MIEVGNKSKLQFHWKVNPYDYSQEKMNSIITKASKKYGVHRDKIKVIPDFILTNKDGEPINLSNDLIKNIQNPSFQLTLFKEYLSLKKIEDYDFEFIKQIDSEVNANIDYENYDKSRSFRIKWVKWDNFLSYGKNNYFDFTTLKGLTLLNGEPANQSGKTTFAIDLLHFLLFGKSDKADVQEKIFNKFLKEETTVVVEGCLEIEGTDYVIKRTLTRPQLSRRTSKSKTTQTVQYYKIVGDTAEELFEYAVDENGENTSQTNKIIKETIGNENDFDLIACATSGNLDDLIKKKNTERGRILSRWIGLLPIEDKEKIAKEKYNNEIKPYLISNRENVEKLQQEINSFTLQNGDLQKSVERYTKENLQLEETIRNTENVIKTLLESKRTIEETAQIDINTVNLKKEKLIQEGTTLKELIANINARLIEIGDVDFSKDEYDKLLELKTKKTVDVANLRNDYKYNNDMLEALKKSEYCPTCGRKYENIDNSAKIKEFEDKLLEIKENGTLFAQELKEIDQKIEAMKIARDKYDEKSQLTISLASNNAKIADKRNELKEILDVIKVYNSNAEAIKFNNDLSIKVNTQESYLQNCRNTFQTNTRYISDLENNIKYNNEMIVNRENIIKQIKQEEITVKHWKIYLDMIGKDGISKMVLRNAIPIINAQLSHLLYDVCDFSVAIDITEKNEVNFNVIKENTVADISSCSGFESTTAALALRFVLAKNSIIPKMSYIVLDELFGRVASENLENMHTLLNRVKDDYETVIVVTHLDSVKDWCDTTISVVKDERGVSSLKTSVVSK